MLNGMKRLFATFAASTLLAASALVATPASAQTGGGGGPDRCYAVNSPYDCCEYIEEWGGWYRFYVWGMEPCNAYWAPVEPDGPSQEPPESPGQ
ncbi:MAG TPA: hypothetical protein VGB57_11510 [Allosphingosinicella sp.]